MAESFALEHADWSVYEESTAHAAVQIERLIAKRLLALREAQS